MTDTLMDGGLLHPGSKSVLSPQLNLFTVPPTDLSMSSYHIVPIQTYTTGINPVEFQVDPQEDCVDLSRSFFEIELALKLANGDNVVQATRLAHKQFGPHFVQTDQCETQGYLDQSSNRHLSLQSIPGNIAQIQQR